MAGSASAKRWTVGELAKQAGVSPGILRHYDKLGLLRPASTSTAGYRLYSAHDRSRLDLIRALRALDFDLDTIARLLAGRSSVRAAAELHLRALDLQARLVGRRRAVLRVLLGGGGAPSAARLARLQLLSDLERGDRSRFLSAQLERRLRDTGESGLHDAVRMAANVDLPESPTDAHVEAWLELAELVSDPDFLARYRGRAPAANGSGRDDAAVWMADMQPLYGPAAMAARAGVDCTSAKGQKIVLRWARAIAQRRGTPEGRNARATARALLDAIDASRDPREERFWTLVGVLRPEVARSPIAIAWPWLMGGLRSL